MASDADLERTQRLVEPRPGWWEHDGSRVCLFDVEAELSALHWAFFDEVGISAARFLYLSGLRAAVAMTNKLDIAAAPSKLFDSGIELLVDRGYGTFRSGHARRSKDVRELLATGTLEAWAYLRRQDRSTSPVCNYTRGLLAGLECMAVEPVGRPSPNVVCWEIECVAAGARDCRFVIGSAENLAAHGWRPPGEQASPRWELESLNAQLKLSTLQLREIQSRLDQHQQAYQHLLDNLLDPLLVVDRQGRVLFANLRFHDVAQRQGVSAIGASALDFVHTSDWPTVESALKDLSEGTRASATFTFRSSVLDPPTVYECVARTISRPDGDVAIEAICRDITERERSREALETAHKQLLTKQRIADTDLKLAKRVHESLLAEPFSNDSIDVDVKYVPVDRVGGDYCHIDTVDGRYVVLTICDVSGHGIAAALLASRVNSHLREQDLLDPDPWAITLDLNQFLHRHFGDTGLFVTFLAITIDLVTLSTRICGAGHPGPIIWRKSTGEVSSIRAQHLPVGIIEEFHRSPHFVTVQLEPGDRLVLYTDGIVESVDDKGRLLRVEGLEGLVQAASSVPLFQLGDWLLEKLSRRRVGAPHDDMTLMLVELKKPLAPRVEYVFGTL